MPVARDRDRKPQSDTSLLAFRLEPPMTWESIPEALLQDLAQLVKANSIEGNKKNNVVIIYTPWSNIKVSYTKEPNRRCLPGNKSALHRKREIWPLEQYRFTMIRRWVPSLLADAMNAWRESNLSYLCSGEAGPREREAEYDRESSQQDEARGSRGPRSCAAREITGARQAQESCSY